MADGRHERQGIAAARCGLLIAAIAAVVSCGSMRAAAATPALSAGGTSTRSERAATRGINQSNWPSYGHDLDNTRTNLSRSAVDRASVGDLKVNWTKDGLVGVTGTPVVADGDVYFGDWQGNVWAVKAATGRVIWTVKVGGDVVGSPAIAGNALYVGVGDELYRLDAASGAVVWKTVTNANPFSQINASPVVVGDLVIQGTAQFEEVVGMAPFTFRGSIGAFNTATGTQVWNFVTTPNNATSGAGEGVWSTPAVDRKIGLLYVGTGQNISEPTGPLADSLLAINYRTGVLKWSRQFTNPDVFGVGNFTGKDADVGASPNLWTSHGREMVGVGQKNGVYHALNAATGKEVWNTMLTPGSTFGGVLGSAALVDGKIIASSNVGDPATNATTGTSKIFSRTPPPARSNGRRARRATSLARSAQSLAWPSSAPMLATSMPSTPGRAPSSGPTPLRRRSAGGHQSWRTASSGDMGSRCSAERAQAGS